MKLPHIDPILPKAGRIAFDGPDWIFDLKYDGFRAVLYLEDGRCKFRSKRGKLLSFSMLERSLTERIRAKNAILDGEICSLAPGGWPDFRALMRREGEIAYIAFDLLWLDGKDLRDTPLSQRKKALERFREKRAAGVIRTAFFTSGSGVGLFELARTYDLEGMVAKRTTDLYWPGVRWYKIKNPDYSQNIGRYKYFRRSS